MARQLFWRLVLIAVSLASTGKLASIIVGATHVEHIDRLSGWNGRVQAEIDHRGLKGKHLIRSEAIAWQPLARQATDQPFLDAAASPRENSQVDEVEQNRLPPQIGFVRTEGTPLLCRPLSDVLRALVPFFIWTCVWFLIWGAIARAMWLSGVTAAPPRPRISSAAGESIVVIDRMSSYLDEDALQACRHAVYVVSLVHSMGAVIITTWFVFQFPEIQTILGFPSSALRIVEYGLGYIIYDIICSTVLDELSDAVFVHHLNAIVGTIYWAVIRGELGMIVVVTYLVAEVPNPAMNVRSLLKRLGLPVPFILEIAFIILWFSVRQFLELTLLLPWAMKFVSHNIVSMSEVAMTLGMQCLVTLFFSTKIIRLILRAFTSAPRAAGSVADGEQAASVIQRDSQDVPPQPGIGEQDKAEATDETAPEKAAEPGSCSDAAEDSRTATIQSSSPLSDGHADAGEAAESAAAPVEEMPQQFSGSLLDGKLSERIQWYEPPSRPYSRRELLADRFVHIVGICFALSFLPALCISCMAAGVRRETMLAVLAFTTFSIVMFGCSAAYHFMSCDWQNTNMLQSLDHVGINLMIMGAFATPAVQCNSYGILAFVWPLGIAGILLEVWRLIAIQSCPRHFIESTHVLRYLIMGWGIVAAEPWCYESIPPLAIQLALLAGTLYTIGVPFLLRCEFEFHIAIWHAFVVAGTICCLLAHVELLGIPTGTNQRGELSRAPEAWGHDSG
eukprot:TRINITY_DN26826_c0_g1_i1.p1 TRINITY_DN26826_c0_g1~~TRINITY_DN26826_c0_g1_i1.p1  ORF type:complete len:731 (+),score=66.83 TRINITY_DN26826_c0_g1_i1:123-2315(+)